MDEKNIEKKQESFNKRFSKVFEHTFLEDFFKIEEKDYVEPLEMTKKTELVIAHMNEAEKILYTILVRKYKVINGLSKFFGLSESILIEIIEEEDEKTEALIEYHQEQCELMYEINEEEFPWDMWALLVQELEAYNILLMILDFMIYNRLMPKYFCRQSLLRKGFLIVKDGGEVIEDDCSFEDEEKIRNQNYPLN